jgi:NADH-quinone oxidoreductase subunit E
MSTADIIKLADLPKAESFALSEEELHAILHEREHYDHPGAAVIEALKIVQRKRGWVPDGAILAIGKALDLPAVDVEGVATFYNLIFRQPVGRHVIKLCDSISCFLTGYDSVLAAIREKLGVDLGQTTPDDRFTLLPICCLGACDKGPVAMIDEDTHCKLTAQNIANLLERYS